MVNQLVEQLLGQALRQLQNVVANPPPLRMGKHLLTAVRWSRPEANPTRSVLSDGSQVDVTWVVIGGEPPNQNCRPVGIIWVEE